jgi:hypothetical protein
MGRKPSVKAVCLTEARAYLRWRHAFDPMALRCAGRTDELTCQSCVPARFAAQGVPKIPLDAVPGTRS